MPITYDGRTKIDGVPHLKLTLVTWCGWTQKYRTTQLVAPEKQSRQVHPRHAKAYDAEGKSYCLSPSLKGYSDISKRFTWVVRKWEPRSGK